MAVQKLFCMPDILAAITNEGKKQEQLTIDP
jgi:hypothetical protein